MKKLLILIGLSMIFVTNAWAGYDYTSLMASDGGSVNDLKVEVSGKDYTIDYTITDRHQTGTPGDQFNNTYKGYYSLDPNWNWQDTGADKNGSLDNFSGFYLGTIKGNDDPDDADGRLATLISYYLGATSDDTFTITESRKVDDPSTTTVTDNDLTVTATDTGTDGWNSGTWELSSNSSSTVEFYTVKGSNEYALYYINPAQTNGVWTTAHLLNGGSKIPQLSHFSGILTTSGPPGNPVPEPATMILFGFGLLGISVLFFCKALQVPCKGPSMFYPAQ